MNNPFSPKTIILNAIRDRLKDTGISKMILQFNVITDKYTVTLPDNNKTDLGLSDGELNTVKKMFISKILKKHSKTSTVEVQSLIILIDLDNSEFNLNIEDINNKISKFNF